MTTRDQLLAAIGSTLCVLGAGGALAPALSALRDICAALLVELDERRPQPAPLPANCDTGHTWIVSHALNKATGRPVQRRSCAVCGLAEEVEATPKPYRRGRSS